MSFTQVGSCPRCGAPIYAPMMWHAVVPPPNQYTCGCFPQTLATYTTNTLSIKKQPGQPPAGLQKAVDSLGDAFEALGPSLPQSPTTEPSVEDQLSELKSELETIKKLLAKALEEKKDGKKEVLKG